MKFEIGKTYRKNNPVYPKWFCILKPLGWVDSFSFGRVMVAERFLHEDEGRHYKTEACFLTERVHQGNWEEVTDA